MSITDAGASTNKQSIFSFFLLHVGIPLVYLKHKGNETCNMYRMVFIYHPNQITFFLAPYHSSLLGT